jgi:hypothetical protein
MTNRQIAIKSFGALALALVLFGALYCLLDISSASAQGGPFPHRFYGEVTLDGAPAAAGTVVSADGDGVATGVEGNPITTTEVGLYGGPEVFDGKLQVQGDIGSGDPIEFYVNGIRARCREGDGPWRDTYPFHSEATTELDLAAFGEYTLTLVSDGCCPISVTYDASVHPVAPETGEDFPAITGGTTVTLEALEDPGTYCGFDSWVGDLITTANPVTIFIRSDMVITATDVKEYVLTTDQTGSGDGSVTLNPEQAVYLDGSVVTLTAVPSDTSVFGGWSGDVPPGCSEDNPLAITMDDDKEITATFDFYSVTVYPQVSERVGNADSEVYYRPQVINIGGVKDTYNVMAVSQRGWSVSVIPTPTVDLVSVGGFKDVAVFVQIPPDAISGTSDVVTLTLTSQGDPRKSANALLNTRVAEGCIPASLFDFSFAPQPPVIGDAVTFTQQFGQATTPVTYAWDFGDAFTGAGPMVTHTYSVSDTYTVFMTATNQCGVDVVSKTVQVVTPTYTLRLAKAGTGEGVITPTAGVHSYFSGTVTTLTATPAENSTFEGWSGVLESSEEAFDIKMDSHKAITATFERIDYTILLPLITRAN